ncbi:52 kDa repressor of the inhibitor of the protein kinase-like [Parasteatoda tepidariorum]|uniref:52 kDa repressor of the inhibitor of the protein kinase-like n=1 Tax=Parasteatoda tepidariorum TaxID=114398 RepID=UPI0039BC607C
MSDIRSYFCKKRKTDDSSLNPSISTNPDFISKTNPGTSANVSAAPDLSPQTDDNRQNSAKLDIGICMNSEVHINDELRLKLLKKPWTPSQFYDFKKDLKLDAKRSFRLEWLQTCPWLAYSESAKGPVCRVCVLFRPPAQRGVQGQFIIFPCVKYHKFNEAAKSHETSQWHREALTSSKNFEDIMNRKQLSVYESLDSAHNKKIENNRLKLRSIIPTILFIAEHELPFRGKNDEGSVFKDLLRFRVESGDEVLKAHLKSGARNALYISHQIQNELIQTCVDVLREEIIKDVKKASAFSVLADETADISGTEQLSIGVRYVHFDESNKKTTIREEFLGFTPLEELNAQFISKTIIQFLNDCNFDMTRFVAQGYDGCAAMAGQEGGVQKFIRDKYPKAVFFHCANHVLNLVINDLNRVKEVQNTIGTTKEIISFFRESSLRRKEIPNIPLLCETRWSEKYKSLRRFSEKFVTIIKTLEGLTEKAANKNTKVKANILLTAATTPTYIVSLFVIATYAAKLEPVCNQLQKVNTDLREVTDYVVKLIDVLQIHRNNASEEFTAIFTKAEHICEELGIEMNRPRVASRQVHRSNLPSENAEEFFRRSLFIPYLDSIISSLKDRFSSTQRKAFSLLQLHPNAMTKLEKASYLEVSKDIYTMYKDLLSPNFITEATTWYEMWMNRDNSCESLEYVDLVVEATPFYPALVEAMKIGLTLPATTCTIERTFSTMRRIKTWNRSAMNHERLSSLCMLSVHKKRIKDDSEFIENIINRFGQQARRLQFLFD